MRRALALSLLLPLAGCSASLKLPGTRDQVVEIVRLMAEAQTRSVDAITAALTRERPCVVPAPEGGR